MQLFLSNVLAISLICSMFSSPLLANTTAICSLPSEARVNASLEQREKFIRDMTSRVLDDFKAKYKPGQSLQCKFFDTTPQEVQIRFLIILTDVYFLDVDFHEDGSFLIHDKKGTVSQ